MSEANGSEQEPVSVRIGKLRLLTNDESGEVPADLLVGLDALKLTYEQLVCTRHDPRSQTWQAVAVAGPPLIVVAETSLRVDADQRTVQPQGEVSVAAYPLSAVKSVELLGVDTYPGRDVFRRDTIGGYDTRDWRLTIDGRAEPVNLPLQHGTPTAELCIQLLQRIATRPES